MEAFPNIVDRLEIGHEENPAFRIFGRRFHKEQTVIEYLAEFLLVFISKKNIEGQTGYEKDIPVIKGVDFNDVISYFPPAHLPLKFFTFFAISQLEKRHPYHRKHFKDRIDDLKKKIDMGKGKKSKAVKALQDLLSGFGGYSGNRAWPTHVFMPVCESLLAREVIWSNSKARKVNTEVWEDYSKFFRCNEHLFMARGGEILFLQLMNLLNNFDHNSLEKFLEKPSYSHIASEKLTSAILKRDLDSGLNATLKEKEDTVGKIAGFIESAMGKELEKVVLVNQENYEAKLGWIPSETLPESLLFGWEMRNILMANIDSLEKIGMLQILCAMQVLRTQCFQASRYKQAADMDGFAGRYTWVVCDPEQDGEIKKLSKSSYKAIEKMLISVIDVEAKKGKNKTRQAYLSGHKLFKSLSKSIGLVTPVNGPGQRFVFNEKLTRFFVMALVPPGSKIRMDNFIDRLFSHYGIALNHKYLGSASEWIYPGIRHKSAWEEPEWLIKSLNAGGFLITLSDAVSIVHNSFQ